MWNNTMYIAKKLVEGKPFIVKKVVEVINDEEKVSYYGSNPGYIAKEVKDFDISNMKYTINIETLRCGQQRRYGDSYYDYNLKAFDESGNFISDKELMEHIIRTCIDRQYDIRVAGTEWFLGKGSLTFKNDYWFYSYETPYLD